MPGWIKMPLGTEVYLGPGNVMLDGLQLPPKRGTSPSFRPMSTIIVIIIKLIYCNYREPQLVR